MDAPLILDLCGGTGAWSQPYREAGYRVKVVTWPDDVRLLRKPEEEVHGILAAPPCDHFSIAGAWLWKKKGDKAILDGLSVVDACLRAVFACSPKWWAMENPTGRLRYYIGPAAYSFQPWWFGDNYTKRTWLWGKFNHPARSADAVDPVLIGRPQCRDRTTLLFGGRQKAERSKTPPGFARAFFKANP